MIIKNSHIARTRFFMALGLVIIMGLLGAWVALALVSAQEDPRPLVEYVVGKGEVVPPGLRTVMVVPPLATLDVGATLQYTAIAEFSTGVTGSEVLDISDQVIWVSMNPDVIAIDQNTGLATGLAVGPFDISVSLRPGN